MREKLMVLVGQVQDCGCDVTEVVEMNYVENITLVDHLIANGVEIPVHCCDCVKCITHIDEVGCPWLFCTRQKGNPMVDPTDFCSYGERRSE